MEIIFPVIIEVVCERPKV